MRLTIRMRLPHEHGNYVYINTAKILHFRQRGRFTVVAVATGKTRLDRLLVVESPIEIRAITEGRSAQ